MLSIPAKSECKLCNTRPRVHVLKDPPLPWLHTLAKSASPWADVGVNGVLKSQRNPIQ